MIKDMFDVDLIDLNVLVSDEAQLFDLVGMRAIEGGVAELGYITGLEKRELSYPTGLQFPEISVALPHVDSKYIKKPFIYIARNKEVLNVKQMGDAADMSTRDFLFLGIKEGSKQPQLLASMMAAFQDSAFVEKFKNADTKEKMYELVTETFKD
ncbi:PTS sugar transporter subunit IIA [Ligilactobacillus equi]|uniref:PTS system galactitol-specific component n=1 Tax=Ligilactobacillus equi DSM 15833 = JCM 10991 TaxID=1423740 RepID=A0A0R1TNY8_9LACO|nr:PTS sugar transporter subunit IIA [Ligilactobacillus equi]KRL80101.1 PTS system galactitol-specific component [Ligilactobacillus equi DSM 15833 = JCM 10991]